MCLCLPVPHTRNGKAPAAANGSVHDCEGTARPAMSLQPPEHLLEPLTVTDPRRAPPLPALATSNPLSVSKDLPNLGIFHINGIIQRVTLRVWLRHLASHSRLGKSLETESGFKVTKAEGGMWDA